MNNSVPSSFQRYWQSADGTLARFPYLELLLAFFVSTFALCGTTPAGEFNATLSVGDQAPKWENLEGVDGKRHGWDDVAAAKCVVVAFTCNSCPYARDVEDRLIELTKEFPESEMRLVAINVNVVKDDSLDAMKQRAQEKAFSYPYLHDPTQKIAKEFGAIKTPEFYVLDSAGKVVYMGALDDSPDGKSVNKRYVADAIKAALLGTMPQTTETVPIGCRVRYTAPRGGR
ncbi:MAG TPA: thioredoxin family protein [Planctomycetaceae bacterium]|nr:thioredoxin family protein [Planctomycetaceae bacterium]